MNRINLTSSLSASFRSKCLWGLLSLSMINQSWADEVLPSSMGALGDSISAAAFAHLPRQNARSFGSSLTLFFNILFAAGGRLFSKDKFYGIEAPSLSWATGLDDQNRVISHARRLRYLNPRLKIYNAAVSGAESDLVDSSEVYKLNKWSRKTFKKEYPDYVTLLIGPNDVCAKMSERMTSDSDFYNRVNDAIRKIVDGNPNSKVLISAIPNIAALRDIAKDAPAFNNPGMNTCLKVWKKIAFCENVQLNDDRREEFEKVEAFNKILKDIAFEQNQRVGGDRVRLSESIYRYRFTPDDLALDCFHPNYMAQNLLADLTFEESWWAKQFDRVKDRASIQFAKEKKEAERRRADAARAATGVNGNH